MGELQNSGIADVAGKTTGKATDQPCHVIAVVNQKGGVAKTTTTITLGAALAKRGMKVLLVDCDPQGGVASYLGLTETEVDELETTLLSKIIAIVKKEEYDPYEGILHNKEGMDLMPSNIELADSELIMQNAFTREKILKEFIDSLRDSYDFILIDCGPSLGLLTYNALTATDEVLIPINACYASELGLRRLFATISRVKKKLNRRIQIAGVLFTQVDARPKYARETVESVRGAYSEHINIFNTVIPANVKVTEAVSVGETVLAYDGKSRGAQAYLALADEVMQLYGYTKEDNNG